MFISVNYLPSFWPRQNVKLKYKNNPRYRSFSTVRVSLQKQGAKNNIAKLEERIKKGEFTATSYSVKLISFLRKLFILVPCIGKNVDSILASIESDQQKKASNSMPIARGDPRIVTGQPFIMPLFQLYQIYGPVFLLSFGVRSIVIVSDPGFAKQILFTNASNYSKGLLSEVLDFVMGTGLIPANGEIWQRRRRVIVPALHRKFLQNMISMFVDTTMFAMQRLKNQKSQAIEMEGFFSRLALDIIGKAVFNYDFDSLTKTDPVIQAVYTVLRETEHRSLCPFPYWKIAPLAWVIQRQRQNKEALKIINDTLDQLVEKSQALVDSEQIEFDEEFLSEYDPSILHFLLASGEDINSKQLRDDLMTLLIAGHETTAAVLTWTFYLLADRQDIVARIRQEAKEVLTNYDKISIDELLLLKFTTRVVNEAMRLYPQPPILIRRAIEDDYFGNYLVKAGSDIFISVWNMHRSDTIWENPDKFDPDRWPLDEPLPDEITTNFAYLPFGGGKRKCVGDKFALFEAVIALSLIVQKFDIQLAPNTPEVQLATGATIHTVNGLYMRVVEREDYITDQSQIS
eukprot:TRINITY_DN2223_c0_g2_i5.p1 TRINITY_DN2223_c0_g2~~TRINITY_DN2223_c0_g2_i5.p1  ORF type:complete len:571 (-),score=26.99 TRINITY_DN2223_c0_g2_i5:278-1990(-)